MNRARLKNLAAIALTWLLAWSNAACAQAPSLDRPRQLGRRRRDGRRAGQREESRFDRSPSPSSATRTAASLSRRPRSAPGATRWRIRATGYELDGPATVEVAAQKNRRSSSSCARPQDLAAQLTNTEWFMSMPGSAEQKRPLIECMSCHTFERIVRSKFNADEFFAVLKRMAQLRQQHDTWRACSARVAERKSERGTGAQGSPSIWRRSI